MKVSIIVPVYQVEDYLGECLESVLNQTYSDYEVILVDDGSPDGSGAICDGYAERDPRFSVIHKENGGLSSARNAGLEAARGDYVYFLDSDDIISPRLLETVIPRMEAGADQVIFQYLRMKDDGTTYRDRENLCGTYLLPEPKDRLSYLLHKLIPCKISWSACISVFSMEKIRKYGQRFQDNRRIFAEDLQFSLCYACHAEKIEVIPEDLYYYRVRENSIMDVQITRSNLGRISLLGETVLSYYRRFDDCSLLVENFCAIYYHLIAGQFTYQMWASGIKPSQYREMVQKEVKDWDFMEENLRQYLRKPSERFSPEEAELRASVLFLLGGSERMLRLRCRILRFLKEKRRKKHG